MLGFEKDIMMFAELVGTWKDDQEAMTMSRSTVLPSMTPLTEE